MEFPSPVVRLLGKIDKTIGLVVPMLDKKRAASNQRAKSILGWQPRNLEEMTVAMAESLIKLGLV
jgi:dihydroflavonol-4-reductase